jgi:hypothetical protein
MSCVQRADVQQHIRAAGIVCDEAIAALSIPHFQSSCSHARSISLTPSALNRPVFIQDGPSFAYGWHGPF